MRPRPTQQEALVASVLFIGQVQVAMFRLTFEHRREASPAYPLLRARHAYPCGLQRRLLWRNGKPAPRAGQKTRLAEIQVAEALDARTCLRGGWLREPRCLG